MSDIQNEKMDGGKKEDSAGYSDRRRKLIKGVAATAPVIMTLANRPVWGAECWSGIQSGNISQHPHDDCFGGLSPGYYKQPQKYVGVLGASFIPGTIQDWAGAGNDVCTIHPGHSCNPNKVSKRELYGDTPAGSWPSYLASGIHHVNDLFPGIGGGHELAAYTFMQALWQFPGSFIFHVIAANFNSIFPGLIGGTYIMSHAVVVDMAEQVMTSGSLSSGYDDGTYTDEHGVIWTGAQLKAIFDSAYHT